MMYSLTIEEESKNDKSAKNYMPNCKTEISVDDVLHAQIETRILYQYLTGVQFRQRIEAIVEAFSSMEQDIIKEKKYFTKKWASQEMQIKKVLTNTIGFLWGY